MRMLMPNGLSWVIQVALAACLTLALSAALAAPGNRAIISAGWGLVVIGIAFKLSLVPAHLWTPDVYQGAPAPVAAFLSTNSKVAAGSIYASSDEICHETPVWEVKQQGR